MSRHGPAPLTCPAAEYREGMVIWCKETGAPCGHVSFYACKGWWVLTPQAEKCPIRREKHGTAPEGPGDPDQPGNAGR